MPLSFLATGGPGVCRHCSRPFTFHGQSHYRLACFGPADIRTHGAVKSANCFFRRKLKKKLNAKTFSNQHSISAPLWKRVKAIKRSRCLGLGTIWLVSQVVDCCKEPAIKLNINGNFLISASFVSALVERWALAIGFVAARETARERKRRMVN